MLLPVSFDPSLLVLPRSDRSSITLSVAGRKLLSSSNTCVNPLRGVYTNDGRFVKPPLVVLVVAAVTVAMAVVPDDGVLVVVVTVAAVGVVTDRGVDAVISDLARL
jgi:hypothetical protein